MSADRSVPGSNGMASRMAERVNRARSEISRTVFALAVGVSVAPAPGMAQDSLTRACDLVAASPFDTTRPAGIPGIADNSKIDFNVAFPACKAALAAAPNNPRLLFQMSRVYGAGALDPWARDQNVQRGEEAFRLLKLAADQGSAIAQLTLGTMYENGQGGLAKNEQEAVRLYKLAVAQGLPIAQDVLGESYEDGTGGLPQDKQEAARLYKLAADQGFELAQADLDRIEKPETLAPKLAAKKDVGDFVCAVDSEATIRDVTFYTVAGYVENTHGDKVQIRVHHKGGLDEAPSDELIWKNYNEVIPCSPP